MKDAVKFIFVFCIAVLAHPEGAAAAAATTMPANPGRPAAAPAVHQVKLKFSDLGVGGPLELRGVQGIAGVALGTRIDEVVVSAKLRLRMTYSPSLLPDLSHLRISLNGQAIAALPLLREQGGREIEREVQLDPRYFTDYNQLRFDLIGHYTLECEDAQHTSLWATLSDRSEIELQLRPLDLPNDLALIPAPFFDRHDNRRLVLPVVLPAQPSRSMVRTAGVVASWFGMLADYRSARFPVSFGPPPSQHALVFATNGHHPTGLTLPDVASPTVTIVDAPGDAHAKLLVFMGKDESQLQEAVEGLVLGDPVFTGSIATVRAVAHKRRPAYDAPRWVRTDRAVTLGELVDSPDQLQTAGMSPPPIRVNLRLPPDLLTWNSRGVPVDLRYRYTAPIERDNSMLSVSINNQFVRSYPLRPDTGPGSPGKLLIPLIQAAGPQDKNALLVPTFQLGSNNQFQFQFAMEYHRQGLCKDVFLDDTREAIDPDSTIDLTAFPHYTAMPNLALFANAGYPFTRYADLGETAIVLPDTADPLVLEELFFILGRMGRHTGAPALAYRLIDVTEAEKENKSDLLLVGGARSNELMAKWGKDLALVLQADDRRFRQGALAQRLGSDGLHVEDGPHAPGAAVTVQAQGSIGALIGFESPLASGRSVVALVGTDPAALTALVDALEDEGKVAVIRGELAIVRAGTVQSYEGDALYYVGSLSWWMRLWFLMSRHPLLLALLALATGIVLALWGYEWLQQRAGRRLAGRAS